MASQSIDDDSLQIYNYISSVFAKFNLCIMYCNVHSYVCGKCSIL